MPGRLQQLRPPLARRTSRWSCRRSTPITSGSSTHSASASARSAASSPSSPTARCRAMSPRCIRCMKYGLEKALVCTYQAISGAGKTFETWPEMIDNVIPYHRRRGRKVRAGAAEALGPSRRRPDRQRHLPRPSPRSACACPCSDGHMAACFVSFKGEKPSIEQIKADWAAFAGRAQELNLPSRAEAVPALL